MATGPRAGNPLGAIHRDQSSGERGSDLDPQWVAEHRTPHDTRTRGPGVQEPRSEASRHGKQTPGVGEAGEREKTHVWSGQEASGLGSEGSEESS